MPPVQVTTASPHMRIVLPKAPPPLHRANTTPELQQARRAQELALALPSHRLSLSGSACGMLERLHGACYGSSSEYLVKGVRGHQSRESRTPHSKGPCCLQGSTSSVDSSPSSSSTASVCDEPQPTSSEEKGRIFRGYLTMILSCVYAVFLVTLGFVIYISDLILGITPMAESFSIYLVLIGLLWFVFLYADIRRYLNSRRASTDKQRINDLCINNKVETVEKGDHHKWSTNFSSVPYYCFSQGRHSGSFYLKIGAAVFCFGHLIHSGLQLGYQVVFLTSNDPLVQKCASMPALILDILYPTYSFVQLFFIFKYSNVIINHCTEVARFAMMHCIASSLCFWVWTILRETVHSLSHHNLHNDNSGGTTVSAHEYITPLPLTDELTSHFTVEPTPAGLLDNTTKLVEGCRGNSILADIENFSPYLYPFTIEYSILVVGVLFIIWQNIGNGACTTSRQLPSSYETGFTSNVVLHADCHSANKGLFAGLIVLVGSAVSIILFFVAMADKAFVNLGLAVNAITELTLLVLMTISVAIAYRQITKLDVNKHAVSLLDDLLLFLCIPAFFLYAILSIVPAVHHQSYISIVNIILQVVQVLLQTPFIIDGLRRCSNSRSLRFTKPGRELVTFLVVCNVAMWIIETFEIKSQDVRDDRYEFYGSGLWTMLSHMTLPLTMFYRFHSSVCLVDIWISAYEPAETTSAH